MVAKSSDPDVAGLSAWQTGLARQADELRAEILNKQNQLTQVEERLTLVSKLIEVETRTQVGSPTNGGGAPTVLPVPSTVQPPSATLGLEEAVEEILRDAGAPLHISDIHKALVARGAAIPGRGDDANIIVRLRRFEDRFTRTARGTYGLAEWGIPAVKSATRKRRRTASR